MFKLYIYLITIFFKVSDATDNYRLTIGGYSGNAGDSLAYQNGSPFSTYDRDNDAYLHNCAAMWEGAWWFNDCMRSSLNGKYLGGAHDRGSGEGIYWREFKGPYYSLKTSIMKIRRIG